MEQDVIGGAAHLWDCIPSKAMIATGGALAAVGRAPEMGLTPPPAAVDPDALKARIEAIEQQARARHRASCSTAKACASSAARGGWPARTGRGRHRRRRASSSRPTPSCSPPAAGPGSPTGPTVDGQRVLSTRDAYPPAEWPDHLVVIGSGVTGVEFVHMFTSLGSEVTLIVSRQQVLPQKDPEVAAALEDELLRRGVRLLKGARAVGIDHGDDGVVVRCDDGRAAAGEPRPARHRLDAQQRGPRPRRRRRRGRRWRLRARRRGLPHQRPATSTRPATCPGSSRSRRWRPCRAASIAEHVMGVQSPLRAASSTTTRPRRPSSPCPRSPTSAWPRPTPSPRVARCGSPRCRSRPRPRP